MDKLTLLDVLDGCCFNRYRVIYDTYAGEAQYFDTFFTYLDQFIEVYKDCIVCRIDYEQLYERDLYMPTIYLNGWNMGGAKKFKEIHNG